MHVNDSRLFCHFPYFPSGLSPVYFSGGRRKWAGHGIIRKGKWGRRKKKINGKEKKSQKPNTAATPSRLRETCSPRREEGDNRVGCAHLDWLTTSSLGQRTERRVKWMGCSVGDSYHYGVLLTAEVHRVVVFTLTRQLVELVVKPLVNHGEIDKILRMEIRKSKNPMDFSEESPPFPHPKH